MQTLWSVGTSAPSGVLFADEKKAREYLREQRAMARKLRRKQTYNIWKRSKDSFPNWVKETE